MCTRVFSKFAGVFKKKKESEPAPNNLSDNATATSGAKRAIKPRVRTITKSIWPGDDIRLQLGNGNIVDWLKTHGSDPELWHFIALYTVPDTRNSELYRWLVLQPNLDAASAVFIFHRLECWEMLNIDPSKISDNDEWTSNRFFIAKTIADRLELGNFQGPEFTVFKLEDNLSPQGFRLEIESAIANFGAVPFNIPDALFKYEVRKKIDLKLNYSDYHYNLYGDLTGDVIVLEGPYRELLANY